MNLPGRLNPMGICFIFSICLSLNLAYAGTVPSKKDAKKDINLNVISKANDSFTKADHLVPILFKTNEEESSTDLPVGIPTPSFGWNLDTDNLTPTIYVDNTNPGCDNNVGTESQPLCDLFKGGNSVTYNAGDVVLVKGESYDLSGNKTLNLNGTVDNPVVIKGESADRILFDAGGDRVDFEWNGEYAVVENLDFFHRTRHIVYSAFTSFKNIGVRNPEDAFIDWNPVFSVFGHDVLIHQSEIGNNRRSNDLDSHGIQASSGSYNLWILDNELYNNNGDSFQGCDNCLSTPPHHIYIGRNILHDDRENAIDLKTIHDVVISENIMYGYGSSNTSNGDAIVVGANGFDASVNRGPRRIWIINNEIRDSSTGIRVEGSEDVWIIGNVISDVNKGLQIDDKPHRLITISANTIQALGQDGIEAYGCQPDELTITNNFFLNVASGYRNIDLVSCGAGIVTIDNNFFEGSASVRVDGTSYTGTSATNGTSFAANNLEGNALLESNTFIPSASSPLIDAGVNLNNLYADFSSSFSADIAKDIRQISRPTGNAQDIGAYEFGEPSTPAEYDPLWFITKSQDGEEDGNSIIFTVSVSEANETGSAISVDLDFTSGSDAVQADFTTTFPANVEIADGSSSVQIILSITDDIEEESLELLRATISSPSVGSITTATADAWITDNDEVSDPDPLPGEGAGSAIPFDYHVVENKMQYFDLSATSDLVNTELLTSDNIDTYVREIQMRLEIGEENKVGLSAFSDWVISSLPVNGTIYRKGVEITTPGSVSLSTDFVYVPNEFFTGTDQLTYYAIDVNGNTTNSATVTFHVDSPENYQMPLGFSSDQWGLFIAPPADAPEWPSAESSIHWYIDPSDPNCDNEDKGYPDKPRCSFVPHNSSIPAGTKIVVAGDEPIRLANSGATRITMNGTVDNPIFIVGVDNSAIQPMITTASDRTTATELEFNEGYFIISGLLFENVRLEHRSETQANNIVLRHSEVRHTNISSGSAVNMGTGEGNSNDVSVFASFIHDNGRRDPDFDEIDVHGMAWSDCQNCMILDVLSRGNAGDAYQNLNNGTNANIKIGRMKGHSEGENCVDIKAQNGFMLVDCDCWDLRTVNWSNGSSTNAQHFFQNDEGEQLGDVIFLNNRGWDTNGLGIQSSILDGRQYIVGNRIFASPGGTAFSVTSKGGQSHFYFNTASNSYRGIQAQVTNAETWVAGNVIDEAEIATWMLNASNLELFDYNYYTESDETIEFQCCSNSNPVYHDGLAEWQNITGHDENSKVGVFAGFNDARNGDFSLMETSELIDQFTQTQIDNIMPGIDEMLSIMGITFQDWMGNVRPTNGLYDAGATEYSGSSDPSDYTPIWTVTKVQDGEEDGNDVIFTISVSEPNQTGTNIEVDLDFSSGSDASQDDFSTPFPSSVAIANGASSTQIALTVEDDELVEAIESLQVTISAPSVGSIGIANATATITDNDVAYEPEWSIIKQQDGEEGGNDIIFVVSVSEVNETGADISVDIDFANGSDASQDDFTSPFPTSVTISEGLASTQIILIVSDDELVEENETLQASISNPAVGFVEIASASATITDNDVADTFNPIWNITRVQDGTEGGAPVILGVEIVDENGQSIVNTTGSGISADIDFSVGSDATIEDFIADSFPISVEIETGTSGTQIVLPIEDDSFVEDLELIIAVLTNPSIGSIGASIAGAIVIDNDFEFDPIWVISTIQSGDEDGNDVIFEVALIDILGNELTNIMQEPISVNADFSIGSSATFEDFSNTFPSVIEIQPGSSSTQIILTPEDDSLVEDLEILIAMIFAPSIGSVQMAIAGAGVTDNDVAFEPNWVVTTVQDSHEGDTEVVIFEIALVDDNGDKIQNSSNESISVDLDFQAGSDARQSDFSSSFPSKATITQGDSSTLIALAVDDDALVEGNEVIQLTIVNPSVGSVMASSTYATIEDNDGEAVLSAKDPNVSGDITLFPNPVIEYFEVQLPQRLSGKVEVVNLNGQVLITESFDNQEVLYINASEMAPNVYMIKCITEQGSSIFKMIKK